MGEGVGDGVGDGDGEGLGEGDGDGDGEGVGVGVGDGGGVGVGIGVGVGEGVGVGVTLEANVVVVATLDKFPKTAFKLRVPRKAINWNWYWVVDAKPSTVQVLVAPIWLPTRGTAQVPKLTLGAEPQDMVGEDRRTSYLAGLPVPSLTSVKDKVTLFDATLATVRLETVPGRVGITAAAIVNDLGEPVSKVDLVESLISIP